MGTIVSKGKGNSTEKGETKDKRTLIKTLGGHTGGINCMDVSPSNLMLLTGSDDRTARMWDLSSYQCMVVLEGHVGYISCCKMWSNQFAITGSFDKSVRKWNVVSGNCVMKFEGHSGIVNRMLLHEQLLFTTSYDSLAMCWELTTGQVRHVFRGHSKSVLPIALVGGHDDNVETKEDSVVTGSMDGTARLWDVGTGSQLRCFRGHKAAVLCLVVDHEKKLLFTGSSDHFIKKWNLSSGEILKSFKGHEGSVICLQLSKRLLYSASVDATARCWVSEFGDTTRKYVGHGHMISDMKYQRGIVFTASGDTCVRAFHSKSGNLKRTFRGHKYLVNCILPLEDKILSGSYDGTVKVWNTSDLLMEPDTTDFDQCSIASRGNHRIEQDTNNGQIEQNPRDPGKSRSSRSRRPRKRATSRIAPTDVVENNQNNSNGVTEGGWDRNTNSSVETPNRFSADEDFSRECSTIVDLGSHADKKPHLIGSDTTSSGYGESLASSPTSYAAISHTSKKKNAVSFTSPSHHQSPRATHTNSPINLKNTLDRRKEFEQEILDMI